MYLLCVSKKIIDVLGRGIKIEELSNDLAHLIHKNEHCMLIVGNDFLKSELDKLDLIEFEDYIYEKYIGKKIAIIYGNCHTIVVSEILQQCPEFNKIYSIYPIKPIHTITDIAYFDQPIFKWCDVFIHQSIQKENRYGEEFSSEKIIMRLNTKCQIIAIPNLYRLPICFFPQYTKEPEFVHKDGRSVFFRDSILDTAAENGVSYKASIADYGNGKHFEGRYLNDLLQNFFLKIEKRERDWDIKCLDYIKNHYKTEKLFYDPNHPTNIFLFQMTIQLLKYIGIETSKDSLEDYKLTLLAGYEMPIMSEVKQHFGMTFPDDPEMRQESYNKVRMGKMKGHKDYIKQYFACEWQNKNVNKMYSMKWHGVYYLMKIYNKIWKIFGKKIQV